VVHEGKQGQDLIRVVPDYHGTWDGGLRVTACADSGEWVQADMCDKFPVNFVSGYTLSLDQSGESLAATVSYGPAEFPTVTTQIQSDGKASFAPTLSMTEFGFTFTLEARCVINSLNIGELSGTVNEIWRAPNISGEMRLAQTIVSTTRTSPTPSSTAAAAGSVKWRALSRFPR
jgi:hypothetical protein